MVKCLNRRFFHILFRHYWGSSFTLIDRLFVRNGKFTTGIVEPSGKFTADVIDTEGKFTTDIVEPGGNFTATLLTPMANLPPVSPRLL